jgi:hypothetical protein
MILPQDDTSARQGDTSASTLEKFSDESSVRWKTTRKAAEHKTDSTVGDDLYMSSRDR